MTGIEAIYQAREAYKQALIDLQDNNSADEIRDYLNANGMKYGMCYFLLKDRLFIFSEEDTDNLIRPHTGGNSMYWHTTPIDAYFDGASAMKEALQVRVDIMDKILKGK